MASREHAVAETDKTVVQQLKRRSLGAAVEVDNWGAAAEENVIAGSSMQLKQTQCGSSYTVPGDGLLIGK